MILLAAMLLAAQIASPAQSPQQPSNLTPQQKQELSGFNFGAANVALKSQGNKPAKSQAPLVPVPPLQVPPITNRAVPSSSAVPHNGPEVPSGWKFPHTDLNPTAIRAVTVEQQLDASAAVPTAGSDGRVVYVFGQGTPVMVCAPLRVCALEMQAGEHLQSEPQIGDSRRWEITPVLSGSGLEQSPILIVKPIEAGLETDLIVPTDRHTYVVRLFSDPTRFVSRVAFQYPDEDKAKWTAFALRQEAAKKDAEMLAERQQAKDRQAAVLPMSADALDNLYFDYKVEGDPAYRPERVLDDGVHTYLLYPDDGRFRELPTLLMVVNGKTELVNFRVDGARYVIDRLFDKAILVVGVGKKQTRVTITRTKPYSGSRGKRS
jgi:P-type conjugative transfer protein TrbG